MSVRNRVRVTAKGTRSLYSTGCEIQRLEVRLLLHGSYDVDPLPGVYQSADGTVGGTTASGSAMTLSLAAIPVLNSNPAALAQLYLDFDGDYTANWASYLPGTTPAYDFDGDTSTFSDAEIASIREIWARVAEKFSPFNLNVTTVNPNTSADKVALRVVIGGNGSWMGPGYGGVCYVGAFYNSMPNTAWVFEDNLANGVALYTAEATAHEAGHGFGLHHQSSYSSTGTRLQEYNTGDSATSPIMGASYYSTRGTWWYGTTSSLNTYQDDLAILAGSNNGFGYRVDDHGGSVSVATALTTSGSAVIGSGIIERMSDADYFSFTTGGGTVSFTADVAQLGAMLDLKLVLMDGNGNVIASVDSSTLGETLTTDLVAGTYRLVVLSHGSYGDIGQYTISGTVVPPAEMLAAPSGLTAALGSAGGVELAWRNDALSASFVVQRSSDGGMTWQDIGYTNDTTFTDTAVTAGGQYGYRVYAVEGSRTSDYSNSAFAALPPAAPTNLVAVTGALAGQIELVWYAAPGATGYVIERSADGVGGWSSVGSTSGDVTRFTDGGLSSVTTYFYRIVATNSAGTSNASSVASATTLGATAPVTPGGLTAAMLNKNKVRLSWADRSDNETGFLIERSIDGIHWTFVTRCGANSTSYNDTISRGAVYYYRVCAVNSTGTSAWSAAAMASAGTAPASHRNSLFSTRPVAGAWPLNEYTSVVG